MRKGFSAVLSVAIVAIAASLLLGGEAEGAKLKPLDIKVPENLRHLPLLLPCKDCPQTVHDLPRLGLLLSLHADDLCGVVASGSVPPKMPSTLQQLWGLRVLCR